MIQCSCYHDNRCHFCRCALVEDEREHLTEDEQWADYVLTVGNHVAGDEVASTYTPPEPDRYHILAHAYCAEGQRDVERA